MERNCDPIECDSEVNSGSGIAVYKPGYDCTQQLKSSFKANGAIPVQLTDGSVELRDGSEAYPIQLPNVQRSTAKTFPYLVVASDDGSICLWPAAMLGQDKRIVVRDGVFTIEDDVSSDFFAGTICEADCSEIESTLGVKPIIRRVAGEPDSVKYQLCRIPKCCCTEEDILLTSVSGQ